MSPSAVISSSVTDSRGRTARGERAGDEIGDGELRPDQEAARRIESEKARLRISVEGFFFFFLPFLVLSDIDFLIGI